MIRIAIKTIERSRSLPVDKIIPRIEYNVTRGKNVFLTIINH